jgi:hypothetical protein
MSSGTVNITATGDAIDAGDTAISISGGNITATLASADVKAIKQELQPSEFREAHLI